MARRFAFSSGDVIVLGGLAGTNRSGTIIALAARNSEASNHFGIVSGRDNSDTITQSLMAVNGRPFGSDDFGTGGPEFDNGVGDWFVLAYSKASGNTTYRYHVCPLDTGVWTHGDTTGTTGDGPGGTTSIQIGAAELSANCDIAAIARFGDALDDSEIEALGITSMADWLAAGPIGAWQLNQVSTSDPVLDLTDGGADQTAITGTTVVGDPPGWTYAPTEVTQQPLTPAIEVDTAVPLAKVKLRTLGVPATVDQAIVLGRAKQRALGPAIAAEVAVPLRRVKRRVLGTAIEVDMPIAVLSAHGATVTVWDGAAEIPATVTVWDGAAEIPATVSAHSG